jgi:putative DNA methylase
MAIAAQGNRQRHYLPPDPVHVGAAQIPRPADIPEETISEDPRNLWCVKYGLTKFGDLFTNRQLTTLSSITKLVGETRQRIMDDCGDHAYADAVATYLALAVSKILDRHSSLTTWNSHRSMEQVRDVFAHLSLPMTWDYAESNPFSASAGNIRESIKAIVECLRRLPATSVAPGTALSEDAALGKTQGRLLVATDPPYYDNLSYANLSDFYYVWLRRSLGTIYPDLMGMVLTSKLDEIVADPTRHGGVDAWEILLGTLLKAGWMMTASWPIRTERGSRVRALSSNALGSSLVLTCRPRPPDAPSADRRGIIAALRAEMPEVVHMLVETGIGPADLRQSMIGPGMKIFSRYARVNEPDGERMSVASALKLINQVFDSEMSYMEGDITSETRWCIDWFARHGFESGPFSDADTLTKGTDTTLESLQQAGLIHSRKGRVCLVPAHELPAWRDPAQDDKICEWLIALQLAEALRKDGSAQASRIMVTASRTVDLETVRELAYRIYITADSRGWKQTATLLLALDASWRDLEIQSKDHRYSSTQDPLPASEG